MDTSDRFFLAYAEILDDATTQTESRLDGSKKTMIDFKFNFGDKVYDAGDNTNGTVTARKYEEYPNEQGISYLVSYKSESGVVTREWTDEYWLTLGHQTMIE